MTDSDRHAHAHATASISHKLGIDPVGKLLRVYALPAIVGCVVNMLYNVADRIFIARGVSSIALSGLSVTLPVMTFLQAFGMLVGAGAAARISILFGQRRRDLAEALLGNAFLLTLLFSLSTIALCFIFLEPILICFGASEASLPYAVEYLNIALPGNIFANITFSYTAVMRSVGHPQKAMYMMLLGALLNVLLDPIFIFGFGLGIAGAAIATVISMTISAFFVVAHFLHPKSEIRLRLSNFRLEKKYVLSILSIGISPFAINALASLISIVKNRSLLTYGADSDLTAYSGDMAVASYGIVTSIAMLILMVAFGISQGTQPIIGYNYGARNIDRVKQTFHLALKINVMMGVIGSILSLFIPRILASVFTQDPVLLHVTERAISTELPAMWAIGFQITCVQFFYSIGKATNAIILSLSRQLFFLLPLMLILPRFMGVFGVWVSSPVSDVIASILSLLFISHYFRNKLDK